MAVPSEYSLILVLDCPINFSMCLLPWAAFLFLKIIYFYFLSRPLYGASNNSFPAVASRTRENFRNENRKSVLIYSYSFLILDQFLGM